MIKILFFAVAFLLSLLTIGAIINLSKNKELFVEDKYLSILMIICFSIASVAYWFLSFNL